MTDRIIVGVNCQDTKVYFIRLQINNLLASKIENSFGIDINYQQLLALMIIGGYYQKSFPGDHNSVTMVSNLMGITYEQALNLCASVRDHLIVKSDNSSPYHKEKSEMGLTCPLLLSEDSVEIINEVIGNGTFNKFRNDIFTIINNGVYCECESKEEWKGSQLNLMLVSSTIGHPIWEKLLELPCVDLMYKDRHSFFHKETHARIPDKDICGNNLEDVDLARIVKAKLKGGYVSKDDEKYLKSFSWQSGGIIVNGVRIILD